MRKIIINAIIVFVLALTMLATGCAAPVSSPSPSPPTTTGEITFQIPKKSPHYESNTPAHEAILAGVPINVVIDFNFDLGPGSDISITSNGKEYGAGQTVIDTNKLAMRRSIDPSAPDGLYTVNYTACWPDGSCHDGSFQFAIDRSKASEFNDMKGQAEITVTMRDIAFVPQKIRISRNTTVTWVNEDDPVHFVNTDSHPAHTYYLPQNSRGLNKGDMFSVVFDTVGIYPYHCSAHTNMTGTILVE